MTQTRTGIGIIGCGVISEIYLKNLTSWPDVEVVAVADMLYERAEQRAKEFNVGANTVEQLLANPDVDVILNLTIPAAHAEVGMAALNAGKAIYTEKPLAAKRADGKLLIDLAAETGLRIGGAPDTFLGGSLQTCRKLLDDGVIGEPVAATAFFASHGPETWHPQPGLYLAGGGPMFDMGPYYVTALATLLGGVRRVSGSARASFDERVVGPLRQTGAHDSGRRVNPYREHPRFRKRTNRHPGDELRCLGVGRTTHRDLRHARHPQRSRPEQLRRSGSRADGCEKSWRDCPIEFGFTKNSRGIGLRDMARAMRDGGPHRADGALTYHVLDVMTSIFESSAEAGANRDRKPL